MSSDTQKPLVNGSAHLKPDLQSEVDKVNEQLKKSESFAKFHGDALIGVSGSYQS